MEYITKIPRNDWLADKEAERITICLRHSIHKPLTIVLRYCMLDYRHGNIVAFCVGLWETKHADLLLEWYDLNCCHSVYLTLEFSNERLQIDTILQNYNLKFCLYKHWCLVCKKKKKMSIRSRNVFPLGICVHVTLYLDICVVIYDFCRDYWRSSVP